MGRFGLARFRLWQERAFWVVPTLGVLFGLVLQRVLPDLDEQVVSAYPQLRVAIAASSAS